jgi:hypothetical protein
MTMTTDTLPRFNMDKTETGCCPRFDPTGWDEMEFRFEGRRFLRARTVNFLHIPLNMGAMMKRTWNTILQAGAAAEHEYLVLSTDPSPWRGEHLFAVTKDIPNCDMVRLSGRFLTKVFEGPYHLAGKWVQEMNGFVASRGKQMRKFYFFYTTCPKCAKQFGKNYVVAFAEID